MSTDGLALMAYPAPDEQPPWLDSEKLAPVIQAYEARIAELRGQNAAQAKAMLELRQRMDKLVEVWSPGG